MGVGIPCDFAIPLPFKSKSNEEEDRAKHLEESRLLAKIAYIIPGTVSIAFGVFISLFSFCTTQLTFSNGYVIGGCYENAYFIPYGLGLMTVGICLIATGTLSKRKPLPVTVEK